MGRKPRPNENKRKQRSKSKKDHQIYPVNNMSDLHFEKGDKDGGYDNWIPVEDKNYHVDKNNLLNRATAKALIPKQKRDTKRY